MSALPSTKRCSSYACWNLQETIEYFHSDREIANAMPAEEFSRLFNPDKHWLSVLKSALDYQGFDTSVMISQLVENSASYLARKPDDLNYELRSTGVKSKCFTNKETLHRDMNFLITVSLTQNSHINKIITKARGPVKDILIMLKEKYDIKDGGTSLQPRVITLPRITRTFPKTCVIMFHKKVVKEIVPYDTFPGCAKPETHAICCPLLPSVCPFTLKKGNNFHPVMLWVQIKLDNIIHRQDGKTTSVCDILSYYRATYESKATPEDARLRLFSQLGIIIQEETCSGPNWKLTDSSGQLTDNCLSELDKMRKEDEDHALLMNLAKSGDF